MNIKLRELNHSNLKLNIALNLERKPVGIKFIYTEDEYYSIDVEEFTKKMSYCLMVKTAGDGKKYKVKAENFGCPGGATSLGFKEVDNFRKSGYMYRQLGLAEDLLSARKICKNISNCNHKPLGLVVQPLESYLDILPDIVLIITNPYNTMRVIQGYSYKYGTYGNYKMSGNQAICAECTSYPFESNNINISMLCGGTRCLTKWDINDVGIGIPYNRFSTIVDGVYNTINAIEPNENKRIIEEKLKEHNIDKEIIYNYNYFSKKR